MHRLRRFFGQLKMSIDQARAISGSASWWATAILGTAGITLSAATAWLRPSVTIPIGGWAVPLLLLFGAFLWKCGQFWERVRGPEIAIGELEYNPSTRNYFIRVTNCIETPCTAHVFLTNFTHADGRPVQDWRGQIEARWSGNPGDQPASLPYKGAVEAAEILQNVGSDGTVVFHVYPLGQTVRPIHEGINRNESLLLTISAYCDGRDETRGNKIVAQFRLIPSGDQYEYTAIRS
jgi:hypothetical protein